MRTIWLITSAIEPRAGSAPAEPPARFAPSN
jgi:hypothetical protein